MSTKALVSAQAVPTGVLKPVTATNCGRYDEKHGATLIQFTIQPGLFTNSRTPEPLYLQAHWASYVHPEGQLYFCRHLPFRVVTEAYIHDPEIMDKITYWISRIADLLKEQDMHSTLDMELFLALDGEDCKYYLVDYATKIQFWLHPMSTDDLNLSGVLSDSHLKIHLESLYWKHVENFPMHSGPLEIECLDELMSIFSHGLTDKITSSTSTFFHDQEQCKDFVKLLKNGRNHLSDGHQICLIARLWSNISDHRYSVHYGTQYCRLDRTSTVLWAEPAQVKWVSTIFSRLSFKAYDTQLSRFRDLFCDRLVYREQWSSFMTESISEWQDVSYKAMALLLLHVFPLLTDSSAILGVTSFALCSTSLLSSVLLLHRYKPLRAATSAVSYDHIAGIESEQFGFQFAAFATVLPSTTLLWGILVFFINCLYCLYNFFGVKVSLGVCAVCILIFVLFQGATSQSRWSLSAFVPSFLHRRRQNDNTEAV